MSRENVEVVRRFEELMTADAPDVDAFAPDRVREALDLLHEGVVFRPFSGMPGHGGDWIGRNGFLEMCKAYGTAWRAAEGVEAEYLDAGKDKVVVLLSFDSTSRHTGRTAAVRMVEIFTMQDGRITELVPYYHDGFSIVETAGGPKTTVHP